MVKLSNEKTYPIFPTPGFHSSPTQEKKKIMPPPPPQPEFHAPPPHPEKKICPAPQFWISCPPTPISDFMPPLFIHLFCGLFGVWGRVSDEQYYWNVPPEVNSTRKCEMYGFFGGFFLTHFFVVSVFWFENSRL